MESHRPRQTAQAFLLCLLTAAACGDGSRPTLQVERNAVGDTLVVRTVAGSAWGESARLEPEMRIGKLEGEDADLLGDVRGIAVAPDGAIYLYDAQVPALRKYAPDGTFIATFGREGGGPGEYRASDGGLAVLPDGRVLLRDPGNARIDVYDPDGLALDTWPLRGGYFTSRPLYVDTAGFAYTQIPGTRPDGTRYAALQLLAPDGTPGDTILAPEWDFDDATVVFSTEEPRMVGGMPIATIVNPVPFTPRAHWTFSPLRFMIGGLSTEYAIDVFRPDGTVLRIRRDMQPVPLSRPEKDAYRMATIRGFQRLAPDWKWNGPPHPGCQATVQGPGHRPGRPDLGAAVPARLPGRAGRSQRPLLHRPVG